jgi:2-polyprenyl-6-hydroxyphenyl methylase / 3-demethylubiquinone-9 3-methyltransferase
MLCPICSYVASAAGALAGGHPLWQCHACGHRFAPASFNLAAGYDLRYPAPGWVAGRRLPLRLPARQHELLLLPALLRFMRAQGTGGGRRMLDIGGALGGFGRAAALRGWQVVELAEGLAQAEAQAQPYTQLLPALYDLVVRGERFEAIAVLDVLEHTPEPVSLLSAATAALAPGGTLFSTVPNWDCELARQAPPPCPLPPRNLQYFTRHSLAAAARRAGLAIRGVGPLSTDPCPPAGRALAAWAFRRLRRQPVWQPQLWLLGRVPR